MIRLNKATDNTVLLKISDQQPNTLSGSYMMRFKHIQTDRKSIKTFTDVSLFKNFYSKFEIDAADLQDMETGEYSMDVYDLDDTETLLLNERMLLVETMIDTDRYYIQSGETSETYSAITETISIPSDILGFNAVLTHDPLVVTLSWYDSASTNYYEVWRKIDGGDWDRIDEINKLMYKDNYLETFHMYEYRVRAGNAAGWSAYTTPEIITT
jgi:hypothetical protein